MLHLSPKMGQVPGKLRQAGHCGEHLCPIRDKRMDGAHEGSDWTTPQSWAMSLESQRHILEMFGGLWEFKKKKLNINDFPPCLGASD